MKRFLPVLSLLAAIAPVASAFGQIVTDSIQGPIVGRSLPRDVPLSALRPELLAGAALARTPALNTALLLLEDKAQEVGPTRMGVVQPVNLSSSLMGAWSRLDDGRWIWMAWIRAEGALSTRLHIQPWNPPLGAHVTIHNAADPRESFGPLDSTYGQPQSFWLPAIYSPDVVVEYVLPAGADPMALGSELVITELLSGYRSPAGAIVPGREMGCHLDVTCSTAWAGSASAVGVIGTVINPFGYFCSGAMMTRIPADFCPLFMTATHCGITAATADTIEITWLFQSAICNQPGSVPSPALLERTVGSVLLAQDVTTDWTVVGLRNGVPGGIWYLGWDASVLPIGAAVAGIHHPDGAYKRISFGSKSHSGGSRPNPAGGNCIAGTSHSILWASGLTEPGSSGSPLFDSTQRIRGTLSCGSTPTCISATASAYGRLDQAWGVLSMFLQPNNPVYINWSFGGTELGSISNPFRSLGRGMFAAQAGTNVFINGGSYSERVTIDRPMTIIAVNGIVTVGQ